MHGYISWKLVRWCLAVVLLLSIFMTVNPALRFFLTVLLRGDGYLLVLVDRFHLMVRYLVSRLSIGLRNVSLCLSRYLLFLLLFLTWYACCMVRFTCLVMRVILLLLYITFILHLLLRDSLRHYLSLTLLLSVSG